MSKPPDIQIRNLSVEYGSGTAIKDVTLEIPTGQCVLITGPSGCGKSTLAKVMAGIIPHALQAEVRGRIYIKGMDVLAHSTIDLARHIGMVFQNPSSQLFHLRCDDEVAFGVRNLGFPEEKVKKRVTWALRSVGLSGLESRKPCELSGGQKQRLAIATILAMQRGILVLDEPMASLDVTGASQVITTLQRLHEQLGTTIILIEHRLADAVRLADRVVVMNRGKVVADGDPQEVLSRRRLLRRLGVRRPTTEPQNSWKNLLVENGHPSQEACPRISLQDTSARYNGKPAIENINLDLYPGEFVALVGDNGAGKSTLALVAAGLMKPFEGNLLFEGRSRPRAGLDIALLFQDPTEQLFTDTVQDEISFGPRNFGVFLRDLHEQILEETDLFALRDRRPSLISMGQQQRTVLASCLSLQPKLVILDEPTLGQDWGHLERLMDYLVQLNNKGTTILLITHDYKLVHRYAQRVILMEKGRITLDGFLEPRGKGVTGSLPNNSK